MAGDVLKYKSGKTKEPRQDRSRGRANATSKNNKSLDKLLAAMEAETDEPSPEPTEHDLKFDQSDFDTMTSAEKKIKLNMLLARLQSSPEQVARANEGDLRGHAEWRMTSNFADDTIVGSPGCGL